jgi:hypothetical protein
MPSNDTDAGKPITQLTIDVLATLGASLQQLNQAAASAGVSGIDVAAPLAREMNKTGYYGDSALN